MAIDLDKEFGSAGTTASVDWKQQIYDLYVAARDAFRALLQARMNLDEAQHKLAVSVRVLPVLEDDASVRKTRIEGLQTAVANVKKEYDTAQEAYLKAKKELEAEVGVSGGTNTVRLAVSRLGGWLHPN